MENINYDINSFSNTSDQAANAFLTGLLGFTIVMIIFVILIAIFMVIVKWFLFKKGNKPEWAAIIPIYSDYVLCKMIGVNPWWILIVFLSSLLSIIPFIGSLLTLAVSIYYMILVGVSLARSFGKEDSFAVGLILLPIVFQPMLAFGKAEYIGINPMKDIIFKNYSEAESNRSETNNQNKFCTNCGEKLKANEKFCTSCGKEIK